jgi:hypothetical protein
MDLLKPEKLLAFSGQKRWIFLPGIGSPGKVGTNGIQVSLLQFFDGMGPTLPQLCQNYMLLCVGIGKIDRLRPLLRILGCATLRKVGNMSAES